MTAGDRPIGAGRAAGGSGGGGSGGGVGGGGAAARRAWRAFARFVRSLRLGEDPAGDRLVAGPHARHLHSGLYSTPQPPDRGDPSSPTPPPPA